MRNRPIPDSEPALSAAVDKALIPGRNDTLRDRLLDAGVEPSALPEVATILNDECMVRTAEAVRQLITTLDGLAAGVALQRALLGNDGRSLADDAVRAGIAPKNLLKSENRIRERLEKAQG